MSTKHNCKHPDRGRSHYRERLARRGFTGRSPELANVDTLRRVQERREEATGSPWYVSGDESAEAATEPHREPNRAAEKLLTYIFEAQDHLSAAASRAAGHVAIYTEEVSQ